VDLQVDKDKEEDMKLFLGGFPINRECRWKSGVRYCSEGRVLSDESYVSDDVKCSACRGTGEVPTDEGNELLEFLRTWLKES
jgi:hypothetical protein